jgi:uncharacterized membrane protein YjfL (UPF0719 family)
MGTNMIANVITRARFSFLGFGFMVAFVVMDKVTPYHLWKEIVQEHNMACFRLGGVSIYLIIITSAIH